MPPLDRWMDRTTQTPAIEDTITNPLYLVLRGWRGFAELFPSAGPNGIRIGCGSIDAGPAFGW